MVDKVNLGQTSGVRQVGKVLTGQLEGAEANKPATQAQDKDSFSKSNVSKIVELQKTLISAMVEGDIKAAQQARKELRKLNAGNVKLPQDIEEEYRSILEDNFEQITRSRTQIENTISSGQSGGIKAAQADLRKRQTIESLYKEFLEPNGGVNTKPTNTIGFELRQAKIEEYLAKLENNLEQIVGNQRILEASIASGNEDSSKTSQAQRELVKSQTLHQLYKDYLNVYKSGTNAQYEKTTSPLANAKVGEYLSKIQESYDQIAICQKVLEESFTNDRRDSDQTRQAQKELTKWHKLHALYKDLLDFYKAEIKN